MRIFANAAGEIMAVNRAVNVGDPLGSLVVFGTTATAMLDIDDETNAALATELESSATAFRLIGGVLTRNGQPVTVSGPGQFVQDRTQVQQSLAQLDTFLTTLDGGTNLTAGQVQQAIKFLLRFARFVLRWIARQ